MTETRRRVLITGATRGIGKATARAFLDRGDYLAVNGRTVQSVETAIIDLGGGENLFAAPGDISTVDGCKAVVTAAIQHFDGLDILVNNAGIYAHADMADTAENVWDAMFNANVKATFFCSKAALPALRAAQGTIVNVASEAGLRGYAGITAYCASKGAVVNLTRSMARELAPIVRVNCVCPGVIDTDMARERGIEALSEEADYYPMKRIGTAEEVAKAILYLSSSDAGFITGTALAIDGGATAGA